MALILAVNPGNSHSPTLSRLARELRGCELIGAESCVVAISAIKERVPDVILLPATQARGQADLIAFLKSVPGGVLTLTLPAVESADPVDLARQIRAMLTGVPPDGVVATSVGAAGPSLGPVSASPHMRAAATAAINWVRTRRAQWVEERPNDVAPEPVALWTGVSLSDSDEPGEPSRPQHPNAPDDPRAASDPQSHAPRAALVTLPRAAALVLAIGMVGALLSCWPQVRDALSSTVDERRAPGEGSLTPLTTIALTSNEPAEVSIDGARVGSTPYKGDVDRGTHLVTVRTASAERRLTVAAMSRPVTLEVDFSKP